MQGILQKIYQELNTYSQTEQRIAHVVLENPTKVAEMSLSKFAQVLQVSESEVTEFCEKLGFSSFVQLREALGNHALEKEAPYSNILSSLTSFEKNNLLNILSQTKLIQIVGAYPELHDKVITLLNEDGLLAFGAPNQAVSLAQTMRLPQNSTLLVFQPQHPSAQLIKQVQIAKNNDNKIIMFGEEMERRIGMEADCFINSKKEEIIPTLQALMAEFRNSNLEIQTFIKKYHTILNSHLSC